MFVINRNTFSNDNCVVFHNKRKHLFSETYYMAKHNSRIQIKHVTIEEHATMDEHNNSVSNTIPIPRLSKVKTHTKNIVLWFQNPGKSEMVLLNFTHEHWEIQNDNSKQQRQIGNMQT